MKAAATENSLDESTQSPPFETVHIDTSLQIERCKIPAKAMTIERALDGFGFKATSSFAKFEFKAAWLKDLLYLFNASKQCNRLEDLLTYVNNKLNAHPASRNRLSRCIEGICVFLAKIPGKLPYEATLIRFRAHLSYAIMGAYQWWDRSIDHEFTGTGCIRASGPPQRRGIEYIDMAISKCYQKKIQCQLPQFFEENKQDFIAIRTAIESTGNQVSENLKTARDIIVMAERNPTYLCDGQKCRKLGDVLIALDGKDMTHFAANNDKDWIILAKVLGKSLLNPVKSTYHPAPTQQK